jgi:two-component system, NarL family, sensor histidine kinase UhpB
MASRLRLRSRLTLTRTFATSTLVAFGRDIMWRRISLRHRLNLMFATLLLLWLAGDIGRILASAGPRVQAEARSVSRLTQEFIETSLASLQDSPKPQEAVVALVSSLQYLRHVRVGLGQTALASAIVEPSNLRNDAPRWFRALVHAPDGVTTIPVVIGGRRLDSIVIVPDPSDEVDEVWSQARTEVVAGGALALAVLITTSVFVRSSLRPLGVAGDALARLEAGDYRGRALTSGPPEFVDICARINRLAEALSDFSAANRQLLGRALDAHDEERKAIAHDLHDEFGPHLFALRANAAILAGRLGSCADQSLVQTAAAIRDQVEGLQRQNRRILADLRPAALEELGLAEALRALAEHWRRTEPDVVLALTAAAQIADLGPRASVTVYRFVQEALTNAFRHSGARRIGAELAYEPPTSNVALGDPALAGLRVRIADDGRGLGSEKSAGMGLSGMRERVTALGGEFAVRASPDGGAIVEARFGLRD